MYIEIKKLNDEAIIPTYGSLYAAGCDLSSTESYILKPGERKLFKTGLAMSIPHGVYGRIAPRSGLAYKDGIDVLAGVVDQDYRGDVGVILINHGSVDKSIRAGDRIAQMIFEKYERCNLIESQTLSDTVRGAEGFGSTGGGGGDYNNDLVGNPGGWVGGGGIGEPIKPSYDGTITY